MPSAAAQAPTTPAQAARTPQAQGAPLIPFSQASERAREVPLSWTVTPGTGPITLGPSDLTPNGFLRDVTVHVSTQTPGTLGPGVVGPYFPFSILENVQFIDTGGQKMDDLPGYALLQDNIVGGYSLRGDPRLAHDFSANPISPNFRLRIEREMFADGRGALPNLSGSQKYRVRFIVDALSNIYSTLPTTPPTLQINITDHLWLLPAPVDGGGHLQQRKPPLMGLAQYRESWYPAQSVTNPQINIQVKSTGNLIKYIALWARDSGGVPNDLVFPDPFTLRVDNSYPFDSVPLNEVIAETQLLIPVAAQRDPGVILIPYDYGRGRYVGHDGVNSWLSTSTATWIQLKGRQATPTNGVIDILVCEISVAEVDPNERAAMGSSTGTWQPAIPQNVPGGV